MRWSLKNKFFLAIGLVIGVAMSVVFYWNARKQEEYILQQIEKQAKIIFRQILMTRQWVAKHGGVFVEKLPGVETNPYLIDPEIRDSKGRIYTKRNPALVTRELSEFAEKEKLYKFRVTSLRPINPKNAPDDFERLALQEFEAKRVPEAYLIENTGAERVYRYIAPIHINESCLQCHATQGYKLGDIKGGISIQVPLQEVDRAISVNNWTLFFSALGIIAAVIFTLYLLMSKLVIHPLRQLKEYTYRIGGGQGQMVPKLRNEDEIEALRKAFREMDLRLQESRNHLEEKVRAATKELEEANLKLKELDRLKSDFLSNVSHELRTPLTAISGAVDFLLRQGKGEVVPFLEIIKKNSERLIRMVVDLLDFSRIEAGKLEIQPNLTNLSFLAEEVIFFMQNMADGKKIYVENKIPESIWIMIDEDRIKQVLINLLANAIKFSPPGGRVKFFAQDDEQEVRIYIKDEGPGIARHDQKKIFTKFARIERGIRNGEGGMGLGLAITKGIVEAHGGRIWVDSQIGQGSTFAFALPKREEENETRKDSNR